MIELIVFMAVISIGLVALLNQFNQAVIRSADPLVQLRALECAQGKLDQIMARKFDEATPVGGVPPCGSAEVGAVSCLGIVADSDFDDVGDFNNTTDTSWEGCTIAVSVVEAGSELGLPQLQARRITVTANSRGGGQIAISAYRTNF